ncbi:electroneutral sodium bicarbonate exchanger 1 isoform X2 [Crotalus tigris]|uniref:electroneutral sodium bicarbonate exchanger 1 isoform X2 n=1 Tax=Crotalus tigris TaxID=88082 RepID=UPI00192F54A8|nr:electroneutral sodium bicarbonate exchanger 1 isoform X2 [Crotalus tigris]
MPADSNEPDCLLRYQRPEDEAVVDLGGTSNVVNIHYEPEELEGHRTLYVGVRMPLVRQGHRHHRTHGPKHRKRDRIKESVLEEHETYDTPSQRVHFILGMEEDEEHVPHDLFTEMDEICVKEGEESEWKETARWLKFEEDVEDGGERWSKPYVATLSLHSLFELRSCIINGSILLDKPVNCTEDIAEMILDSQESCDESTRKKFWDTLLKKHHHQHEKRRNILPIVRSFGESGQRKSDPHSIDKTGVTSLSLHPASNTLDVRNGLTHDTTPTDVCKADPHFMKKIPVGAEAANVLIGEADFLKQPIVAFLRLSPAVLLPGMTEVPLPTRFLFILLGTVGKGQQYHEIGRSMATLMTDEVFHDVAYKAKDRNDLLAGIDEFLDQVTVLPPGEWDPSIRIEPPKSVPSQNKRKMPGARKLSNGKLCDDEMEDHMGPELQRTGKLFGGLILDIKRKAPWYWSDYRDALNLKCLASFLFLYCASMSPVITFGGLLGEATDGHISAMESLLGASLTGVVYSLFAGQPLTILGSTGPVLVFEKILYKFCKDYKLSYLALRTSIGLWTTFMCFLLVATDASSLICYITRFTEEAFASLICLIFIFEAIEKLFKLGRTYPFYMDSNLDHLTLYYCRCTTPTNPTNDTLIYWDNQKIDPSKVAWANLTVSQCQEMHGEFIGSTCGDKGPLTPDVLLWCFILFFTTYILSSTLKKFRSSTYFPTKIRYVVGDFAIFITIVVMVLIDYFTGIPSPKLNVPGAFKPTRDDRGWLISPIGPNPWWSVLAAIIPALLCTILIFMDQQITALIVNRKEHKLKKGCGYHLDLLMVGIMLGVCSVMGLPWYVAATVISISHVNSLRLESTVAAPGEQPKFLGIIEQRATGVMIFVLMGLSVFITSVLKFIPMPVLYGVFLYMGVSSLNGIQFFDRLKLMGMPSKHQPDFIYLRHVPLRKVYLFTMIQLTCLIILWVVKASPAAIIFPMMVLALVFVRKVMDLCFSKRELSWLDDLMPESKKKTLEDAIQNAKQEDESQTMMEDHTSALIEMSPMTSNYLAVPGNSKNVPKIDIRPDPADINISEEMPKTTVWKTLTMNTEKL